MHFCGNALPFFHATYVLNSHKSAMKDLPAHHSEQMIICMREMGRNSWT